MTVSANNNQIRGRRMVIAGLAGLAALGAQGLPARADDLPDEGTRSPKETVQAFWDLVWNGGDVEAIDDLMTEDFVIHSAGETIGPRDRFKTWVASFFANIDDLELEVLDLFGEGSKVATRWRCSGRLRGTMFGIEGTGQPIAFTGVNLMVVMQGRIAEAWVERDALGLARSLGAQPTP